MKILLIGEYSNLHNSLKQGLQKNGFEVTLLSTGDGFKNFDSDIPCLLYTSPSPRDAHESRMPSSA